MVHRSTYAYAVRTVHWETCKRRRTFPYLYCQSDFWKRDAHDTIEFFQRFLCGCWLLAAVVCEYAIIIFVIVVVLELKLHYTCN